MPSCDVPATSGEPVVSFVFGHAFAGGLVAPVIYAHDVSLSSDTSPTIFPNVQLGSDGFPGHERGVCFRQ